MIKTGNEPLSPKEPLELEKSKSPHLSPGRYCAINCGLAINLVNIHYQTEELIRFKGILYIKKCHTIVEVKNYEIPKERISHWVKYNP